MGLIGDELCLEWKKYFGSQPKINEIGEPSLSDKFNDKESEGRWITKWKSYKKLRRIIERKAKKIKHELLKRQSQRAIRKD